MAFDGCLAKLVADELKNTIVGAKIEKIYQPTKEEVVMLCHQGKQSLKLFISANPASARICLTEIDKVNPQVPPMFCMLLRKHLGGAIVKNVYTYGFERVIEVCFQAVDDLGFACEKYLTVEIMGKYSNLMLLKQEDGYKKVIGVVHPVDFSTSNKRQVLPGMVYELPPVQDKMNPLEETEEGFINKLSNYPSEKSVDKFILDTYLGMSPLICREIMFKGGNSDCIAKCSPIMVSKAFFEIVDIIKSNSGIATVIFDNKKAIEFSFVDIKQYSNSAQNKSYDTYSKMFDYYYGKREFEQMMTAKSHDISTIITTSRHKLAKKLPLLQKELIDCDEADKFRLFGELITASLYMLKEKSNKWEVVNYYSESLETVEIPLDIKLTASQNADKYYKKYTKLKNARGILNEQINKATKELEYLNSVEVSMKLAENESDLVEIRNELTSTGYSKKVANSKNKPLRKSQPKHFTSYSGYEIIVGKNNTQNDMVTFKLSKKSDWWFHVKNGHGSHVLLVCDPDVEPDAIDFTQAAELAAYYSEMKDSENVEVDYTQVKNIKKPSGSAPGFVVYSTNYSASVTPKNISEEQ
ncbi:MAG: NFACT family protein [Clostridia bacterium]|nr:NFACT family protein [Clostridia bacterium]